MGELSKGRLNDSKKQSLRMQKDIVIVLFGYCLAVGKGRERWLQENVLLLVRLILKCPERDPGGLLKVIKLYLSGSLMTRPNSN